MKKFIAVFLLLVFLGSTAGIFGLFLFQKQDNYESVFKKRDELSLVHLVVPKSKKIEWEKDDEIIYEGKYYDVFGKSEDDKNTYLLCYSDRKDDNLAETFHKFINEDGNTPGKKGNTVGAQQILSENYLLQDLAWIIHQPLAEKISVEPIHRTLQGFILCFSPPPDFLV